MTVGNRTLVVATDRGTIRRWKFGDGEMKRRVEEIGIPRPGDRDPIVHRIFIDPTGSHVVFSTKDAFAYYLHANSVACRPIVGLSGTGEAERLESLAWDRGSLTPTKTGPVLIGSNKGNLFQVCLGPMIISPSKRFEAKLTFRLDTDAPVRAVRLERFPDGKRYETGAGRGKLFMMCATSRPTRVYEFVGGYDVRDLFSVYKSGEKRTEATETMVERPRLTNFLEVPSELDYTELHFYGQHPTGQSRIFAMLTEVGVYHGCLHVDAHLRDHKVAQDETLTTFVDPPSPPLSIALTEFHFVLLYASKVVVKNRLSGEKVLEQRLMSRYEENGGFDAGSSCQIRSDTAIRLGTHEAHRSGQTSGVEMTTKPRRRPAMELLELVTDSATHEVWGYSSTDFFLLHVRDESCDIWRHFLSKALDGEPRHFATSLQHCQNEQDRDRVADAQAKYHFDRGEFDLVARSFVQSSRSFESAVLKLVGTKCWSALRMYLDATLAKVSHDDSEINGRMDRERRTLCTWIVDILSHELTVCVEDSAQPGNKNHVQAFARSFLKNHVDDIDDDVVLDKFRADGHTELLLYYAKLCERHEIVVSYYMTRRQHLSSLMYLNELIADSSNVGRGVSLLIDHAASLMRYEPERTCALLRDVYSWLPVSRLIASLVCYHRSWTQRSRSSSSERHHHGLEFLEFCVLRRGNMDAQLNTCLLTTYASISPSHSQFKLSKFILQSLGVNEASRWLRKPAFDIDLAVRVCERFTRTSMRVARIYLLAASTRFEDAVRESLDSAMLDVAKDVALRTRSEALRRELWLMITSHVMEDDTANEENLLDRLLGVLRDCESSLHLEDLLPYLGGFTCVDVVRESICAALRENGKQISILRKRTSEYVRSSDMIRRDCKEAESFHVYVQADHLCDICGESVHHQPYYVFRCNHLFHVDCLRSKKINSISSRDMGVATRVEEKITTLRHELRRTRRQRRDLASQTHARTALVEDKTRRREREIQVALENERRRVDAIIADDCVLCGDTIVSATSRPFLNADTDTNDEFLSGWAMPL